MKSYTVVYRRKKGSPISYISGVQANMPVQNYTTVEKSDMFVGERAVPVPVVKGTHFRGRVRQLVAEKVLEYKSDWINSLSDREKQEVFKIVSLCYLVGNVQENAGQGNFEVVRELQKRDAFFRYFGYMVANLPNVRSRMSVGFALPVIEDVTASKDLIDDLKLAFVKPEEVEVVKINLTGNYSYFVTRPFIDVETYRVSGKMNKIEKLGSLFEIDIKEVQEIVKSYTQKTGKDKEDFQNILFAEVFAPSYDLVQTITFLDDDVEVHRGILAAFKTLFDEEPFVGGKVSSGYGLIDEVIFFDENRNRIEPTEEDLKRFINEIDLAGVIELIKPTQKNKDKKKKSTKEEE